MTSSSLMQLASSSVQYTWDAVSGAIFDAGIGKFFVLMVILTGAVILTIGAIRKIMGIR